MDSFCSDSEHDFSAWVSVAHAKRRNTRSIPHSFADCKLPYRVLPLCNPYSNLWNLSNSNSNLRSLCNSYSNLSSLSNSNSYTMYTVPTMTGLL